MALGWYVRVTTAEIVEGQRVTTLYVVGLLTQEEAVEAVRRHRQMSGESYEALQEVVAGGGPQPAFGEVRHLKGAI
jgi:hypothetical protein